MATQKPKEQAAPQDSGGIDFGAQQPGAGKPKNELVIFDERHPLMEPLFHEDVLRIVDQRLEGSGLTARDLVVDLGSYFTSNPTLVGYADAPACYNLLLMASAWQCSFGDGGIWPIPEFGTLRGQPSEKLLVNRALTQQGCRITAHLVFEDQDVKVDRSPDGRIESVYVTDPASDPFAVKKNEATLRGGFGIAEWEDGRVLIESFDRDDLERRKMHSAAVQKANKEDKPLPPMWRNDPLQANQRGIRAAMARLVNPIPTNVAGRSVTDSMLLPSRGYAEVLQDGGDDIELSGEDAGPVTADSVAADLEQRMATRDAPEAGNDAGTGSADSTGQEPPRPPLTGDSLLELQPEFGDFTAPTVAALQEKDWNAPRRAYKAFSDAFAQLPQFPESLDVVFRENGKSWVADIGKDQQNHLQILGEIRRAFWKAAAEAGYPQPEPQQQ